MLYSAGHVLMCVQLTGCVRTQNSDRRVTWPNMVTAGQITELLATTQRQKTQTLHTDTVNEQRH